MLVVVVRVRAPASARVVHRGARGGRSQSGVKREPVSGGGGSHPSQTRGPLRQSITTAQLWNRFYLLSTQKDASVLCVLWLHALADDHGRRLQRCPLTRAKAVRSSRCFLKYLIELYKAFTCRLEGVHIFLLRACIHCSSYFPSYSPARNTISGFLPPHITHTPYFLCCVTLRNK